MTSPVTEKTIKKNVWQMPESSKYLQRNLVLDNGHSLVQVLKRSGILRKRIVHKEPWGSYRIKSLSQESKVSKFCMEAGFVHVVEVGQYFMTKDTGDFRHFRSVACREYTLPRDDESSQPREWIQGNMRIGPVLEVTTSYMYGKTWN